MSVNVARCRSKRIFTLITARAWSSIPFDPDACPAPPTDDLRLVSKNPSGSSPIAAVGTVSHFFDCPSAPGQPLPFEFLGHCPKPASRLWFPRHCGASFQKRTELSTKHGKTRLKNCFHDQGLGDRGLFHWILATPLQRRDALVCRYGRFDEMETSVAGRNHGLRRLHALPAFMVERCVRQFPA